MNTTNMTLSHYVNEVFIPVMRADCCDAYKGTLRRVAQSLAKWYGSDPELTDIEPDTVTRFVDETKPCEGYRDALGPILRSFAPDKFPKKSGGGRLTNGRPKPLPSSDGPIILLNAFYSQTYEPNALRSRRPNTKRLYRTTLRKFAEFVGRIPTLDDLNDDTVNGFAAWRSKSKISKHSVNKDLFNLLALWRWAHRKGFVANWPDVLMEKAATKTPVAWSENEIRKLFATASKLPGQISGVPSGVWWVTLLSVAWDSGERIGAIMSLKWSDVDTVERWVRFDAEFRKGARADNLRRIAKDTAMGLASVKRWQQTAEKFLPDGKVFIWPMSPTYIYRELARILKQAGLPHDCKSKFHRIRKSVASFYEKAGGNATELLGHTKRETTKAYLDPRIVERPEAIDLLFRPMEAKV